MLLESQMRILGGPIQHGFLSAQRGTDQGTGHRDSLISRIGKDQGQPGWKSAPRLPESAGGGQGLGCQTKTADAGRTFSGPCPANRPEPGSHHQTHQSARRQRFAGGTKHPVGPEGGRHGICPSGW